MRYKETREQSAELLRMVLPLMARHSASFHPLSYAVWYEYVAGTNLSLRSAIDEPLDPLKLKAATRTGRSHGRAGPPTSASTWRASSAPRRC